MASARELIDRLHNNGLSYSEIGRRIGRDSSLVSQIARGKKPGTNLVGGLESIAGGASKATPPRRITASGAPAKVRKGVTTIPGTENISVKTKRGNKTILKGLDQVSGKEKFAKWNVRFTRIKTISDRVIPGGVVPGRLPRGWDTNTLRDRINNPQQGDNWRAGDARGALAAIALDQNRSSITSAGAIVDVHIFTTD